MGKMRKARMFLQSRSFGMGLTAFSLVVVVFAAGMFLTSGISVWSARGQQAAASSDAVSRERASLDANAVAETGENAEANRGEVEGDANPSSMGSAVGFGTHGGYAPATGASASGQGTGNGGVGADGEGAGGEGASGTEGAGNGIEASGPWQEYAMSDYCALLSGQAQDACSNHAATLSNSWHGGGVNPVDFPRNGNVHACTYDNWADAPRARYACNAAIEAANRFLASSEFLPPSNLTAENAARMQRLYDQVSMVWTGVKQAAELLNSYCDAWAACPDVYRCPECFLSLADPHIYWYTESGQKVWTIDYLMNARQAWDAFYKQEQDILNNPSR